MRALATDQYSPPTRNFPALRRIPLSHPTALIELPDGKQLACEEYGDADGFPLLYFHDGGSSRLECSFFHPSARRLGFRLIAVDRPGIGCSDYYELGSARQFSEDLLALVDALGIGEFGLLSLGAGGIYALNLAHAEPDRITTHLNLAGIPGNVFNEASGRSCLAGCWNELTPALVKFLVRIKHRFFPDSLEQSIERFADYLSSTDRKTLASPGVIETLVLDHREALRRGCQGVAQDLALCFRKLDFSLRDVPVPTAVWRGGADRLTRRADCEYLVARMPHASFHRVPSRGHFFFVHHMDEVFSRLPQRPVAASAIAA